MPCLGKKKAKINMEEKKSNWGGRRTNQTGRPRKEEEQSIIELLDKHIDKELVLVELLKKIKAGDNKAIQLYFGYRFGKPLQTINQTTTLNMDDFDISKLVGFEDKKDENNDNK